MSSLYLHFSLIGRLHYHCPARGGSVPPRHQLSGHQPHGPSSRQAFKTCRLWFQKRFRSSLHFTIKWSMQSELRGVEGNT